MESLFDRSHLAAWTAARRGRFEEMLKHLVEIPTVSVDPARRGDVDRGAEAAAEAIRSFGGTAEVLPTAGLPVVWGGFGQDPSHPTVTVYNHMDVQPADRENWTHDPFTFQKDGDRYGGRGTTDDKGPALAALFGAACAVEAGLPLNIRFLWEFEEEIGSPNFAAFVAAESERLRTDSVIVSDTIWIARGRPSLSSGLRGLQGARLRLETGTKDVHSGVTGGAARNPFTELADLLSKCVDGKTGRVKIPGFYRSVVKPTREEIDGFRNCGFRTATFVKDHGFRKIRFKDPMKVMKAIWAEPTFEIHGIAGGYQGPGIKTIVPPWAEAKVSMRLVPDQTPAEALRLLKAFVKKQNPDVKVFPEGGLAPFRGIVEGPFVEAARESIRFAFGRSPAFVREGGSIGAVLTMNRLLRSPVLFIGLSLPEHGYHAPNENFDWGQASGGIAAFASYFARISKIRK